MSDLSECNKFIDTTQRSVCRGEKYPLALTNTLRSQSFFGNLPPLTMDDVATATTVAMPILTGVGDEFEKISRSLAIYPKEEIGCGCELLRVKMNNLGITGCRDSFDELVSDLRAKTVHYSLREKLTAATTAVITGLVLEGVIKPHDPMPGLLRIAIKRAECTLRNDRIKN